MSKSFSFASVSPDQLGAVLSQLSREATVTPQVMGTYDISGRGVHCVAVYSSLTYGLTVTIVDKPFYVPESLIESQVRAALVNVGWKP